MLGWAGCVWQTCGGRHLCGSMAGLCGLGLGLCGRGMAGQRLCNSGRGVAEQVSVWRCGGWRVAGHRLCSGPVWRACVVALCGDGLRQACGRRRLCGSVAGLCGDGLGLCGRRVAGGVCVAARQGWVGLGWVCVASVWRGSLCVGVAEGSWRAGICVAVWWMAGGGWRVAGRRLCSGPVWRACVEALCGDGLGLYGRRVAGGVLVASWRGYVVWAGSVSQGCGEAASMWRSGGWRDGICVAVWRAAGRCLCGRGTVQANLGRRQPKESG